MQHSHWSKRNAAVQIAMPRTSLTCVTSSKSLLLCCIWHCSDAICSRSLSFSFSLCLMSVVNRSDSFSSLCICASSIPGGMIRTVCFPKPKSCLNKYLNTRGSEERERVPAIVENTSYIKLLLCSLYLVVQSDSKVHTSNEPRVPKPRPSESCPESRCLSHSVIWRSRSFERGDEHLLDGHHCVFHSALHLIPPVWKASAAVVSIDQS